MDNDHPVPSGSVTFIKYKGHYFVVTNEHCVRKEEKDFYKVFVPSKKTKILKDNQRIDIDIEFLNSDKEKDLAAFLINRDALENSKRSFLDLYPTSSSTIKEDGEVIFIGVPGERLEYQYNEDYTFLHTIQYKHITYFTVHKNQDEHIHEVKIGTENYVFTEKDKSLGKIDSFKGMSGSPAFTHSYATLNINDARFLGITSNADPISQRAYVLDVYLVISFLDKIIENLNLK